MAAVTKLVPWGALLATGVTRANAAMRQLLLQEGADAGGRCRLSASCGLRTHGAVLGKGVGEPADDGDLLGTSLRPLQAEALDVRYLKVAGQRLARRHPPTHVTHEVVEEMLVIVRISGNVDEAPGILHRQCRRLVSQVSMPGSHRLAL